MLPAPPTYNEEFYRNEIENQKNRLETLKSRQAFRLKTYGGGKAPGRTSETVHREDTSAPKEGSEAQNRIDRSAAGPSSGDPHPSPPWSSAVLRVLEDPSVKLPCRVETIIKLLEEQKSRESKETSDDGGKTVFDIEQVVAVLKSLADPPNKEERRSRDGSEKGSIEIEEGTDGGLRVTAVRSRKDISSSGRKAPPAAGGGGDSMQQEQQREEGTDEDKQTRSSKRSRK